jgi:hypothetical protein
MRFCGKLVHPFAKSPAIMQQKLHSKALRQASDLAGNQNKMVEAGDCQVFGTQHNSYILRHTGTFMFCSAKGKISFSANILQLSD